MVIGQGSLSRSPFPYFPSKKAVLFEMLSQHTTITPLSGYSSLELIVYLHKNVINEGFSSLNNKCYKYRDHYCFVQHFILHAQASVWLSVMLNKFLIGWTHKLIAKGEADLYIAFKRIIGDSREDA